MQFSLDFKLSEKTSNGLLVLAAGALMVFSYYKFKELTNG